MKHLIVSMILFLALDASAAIGNSSIKHEASFPAYILPPGWSLPEVSKRRYRGTTLEYSFSGNERAVYIPQIVRFAKVPTHSRFYADADEKDLPGFVKYFKECSRGDLKDIHTIFSENTPYGLMSAIVCNSNQAKHLFLSMRVEVNRSADYLVFAWGVDKDPFDDQRIMKARIGYLLSALTPSIYCHKKECSGATNLSNFDNFINDFFKVHSKINQKNNIEYESDEWWISFYHEFLALAGFTPYRSNTSECYKVSQKSRSSLVYCSKTNDEYTVDYTENNAVFFKAKIPVLRSIKVHNIQDSTVWRESCVKADLDLKEDSFKTTLSFNKMDILYCEIDEHINEIWLHKPLTARDFDDHFIEYRWQAPNNDEMKIEHYFDFIARKQKEYEFNLFLCDEKSPFLNDCKFINLTN